MCETCIFRPEQEGGIELRPGRREEIQVILLQGTNQLCHHDNNKTVCRGGRNFQLQVFHRIGLLPEPTDSCLKEQMEAALSKKPGALCSTS